MPAPTILFGVGATKAGTSWLWDWLRGHPQAHVRGIKELHWFDAVEAGRLDAAARDLRRQIADAEGRGAAPARLADLRTWLAVVERGDQAGYLDYLTAGAGTARLVADVTPAYALLPEGTLRQMGALTPDVRFLYILRDPVDRLWSHVRMIARRRTRDGDVTPDRCRRILMRTLRGEEPEIAVRSDYAGALARLTAAVAPARLMLQVFEEMFAQGPMDRIAAFLGLAPHPAQVAVRVHAGVDMVMPEAARARARDWLAPQYDHAARVLGRMPAAWDGKE
jgi:hypothetical protein